MEYFWEFLFQLMKHGTNILNVIFIFLFSVESDVYGSISDQFVNIWTAGGPIYFVLSGSKTTIVVPPMNLKSPLRHVILVLVLLLLQGPIVISLPEQVVHVFQLQLGHHILSWK